MSTGQPWPPPGCIKEQLGTIFKQISEAQTLDVNGDEMVSRQAGCGVVWGYICWSVATGVCVYYDKGMSLFRELIDTTSLV